MKEKDCRHCVCLTKNIHGELICDELLKNIRKIKECPEKVLEKLQKKEIKNG